MKNIKKTALAAAVLLSVMTGSAWAKTVDVKTAAEFSAALKDVECTVINIVDTFPTYSGNQYNLSLQLTNESFNVTSSKQINVNGLALYDRDHHKNTAFIGAEDKQIVFDNGMMNVIQTYAGQSATINFKYVIFQNSVMSEELSKSFRLFNLGGTSSYNDATSGTDDYLPGALRIGAFVTATGDHIKFLNNNRTIYFGGGSALWVQGNSAKATFSDVLFEGNYSVGRAGAVEVEKAGKLYLTDVQFVNNSSGGNGGAIVVGNDTSGSGFTNLDSSDDPVTRVKIEGKSIFYGNVSTGGNGGAIWNRGELIIDGASFGGDKEGQGNKAKKGGAIYSTAKSTSHVYTNGSVHPGIVNVQNTTFVGNIATEAGGAIYVEKDSAVTLENVTFSGNTAAGKPNDIYNAGTLTLNNVKFENIDVTTVVNAATGNITIGKDTRVSAATIDNKAAATALKIVGGTLVTTQDKRTTDDNNFTMTNGVIELTNDYKLTDIDAIQTAINTDYGQGKFSLKFTGNVIKDQSKPEEKVSLETITTKGLELPTAPVKVDEKFIKEEGGKKQFEIGGAGGKLEEGLKIGTLDVGEVEKIVVEPVNMGQEGEKEIVLEFGNSEASGPLIVTKNNKKVDVELAEGAKIVVADKQKLEIANLDAKNNGDKHVGLVGEIAAEKFNVAAPQNPGQDIICFNVGNDEQKGSLSAEEVDMNGAMVFADPAWADDIEHASAYSQGGFTINGKLVGGRNSVISVGTTDRTVAERIFEEMENPLSFGNEGAVNAVLYVATAQTMADTGAIWIDGILTEKPAAPADQSFSVAAKSLTIVEAAAAGTSGAISGLTSASVDSTAKLYVAKAEPKKIYTILVGSGIESGWLKDNVAVGGMTTVTDIELDSGKTCYKVITGECTLDVSATVLPNVGMAMARSGSGKAYDAIVALVDNPDPKVQTANVNSYANLGENLGVTRGAYDVISMTGDAINQHWANNEDGESVWAVYNHSKDKVDGLKLGGMDAQYDAQYNGVTVGYDINKDFGVALNHVDGNVTNGFGGHNDAKYYGVSVYGRKNVGKLSLLGDVTYSHGKNELAQNGIEADAKTNTFSMGVTAKYATNIVKVGNVAPFAGVRYVRIDGKDYTDSIGVNREADKVNSVIVPMGVEYRGEFNVSGSDWNCKPVLAVGYLFNFGDKDNTMTLGYNGAKDSFGYDFVDNGAFFTKAALNFTKNNLTLGVGYDYMKSSNSNNNRWNVNLNYAF